MPTSSNNPFENIVVDSDEDLYRTNTVFRIRNGFHNPREMNVLFHGSSGLFSDGFSARDIK
jgi:hypothetical protein